MPTRDMLCNKVYVVFDFVAGCIVLLQLPLSSPHSSIMKQEIALWPCGNGAPVHHGIPELLHQHVLIHLPLCIGWAACECK